MQQPSAEPALGTCFGFEIHSDLPFFYLRDGGGSPLHVYESEDETPEPTSEPVAGWEPTPMFPFAARLYRDGERYDFWLSHWGWFSVDASIPAIWAPAEGSPELREVCIWALPSSVCSLARREMCLHASCVEVDGKAVMFSAPGHHGKTTLAAAFMQAGFRVLAEDKVVCRLGSEPMALPGPALLRIRPDVYERLDFPGTRVVKSTPERAYLTFDGDMRGTGDPVPLGAVFFLRPTEGDLAIEPASVHDTLRDLWAMRKHVPTTENEMFSFEAITDLAHSLPSYNLHRPQRFDELPAVVDEVVATCR